jgi:sigma-B regulation protein RsbU (phosphoserine phosphatase)
VSEDSAAPDPQAVLDLAPCGLLRTDAHGGILRVNRTFCRWIGHEPAELAGRRLQDLLTMGGRIFYQTHLGPLIHMQGSVSEVKLDVIQRDGRSVPMVFNAQWHGAEGEAFIEFAAFVARDRDTYERELVASRRRLEALVAEAEALQEQARDRALVAEQMMGIVSHDLRNPLQTIQMGAVLLTRGGATPHQLAVLGRITRATDRAHRLIADLLDFTQARLGKGLSLDPRPIDPHATIADVVDELSQAFPGRALRHERVGQGDCVADPDRLAQLVGNLIANALVYGQPDATVTVRSDVGADGLRLSVHNTGTPIPAEMLPTVFEPLVRGDVGASAQRSVGLGLYIVREIAKGHGGSVSVASSLADGTTFTASFPRAPQARDVTSSPAAPA